MKVVLFAALLSISCSKPQTGTFKSVSIDPEEASGVEQVAGSPLYWVIEDAGNKNVLYGIDAQGKIKTEIKTDGKNTDWESLASDRQGNLYIGDFGNNDNDRRDLSIYKLTKDFVNKKDADIASITTFYYPEQKDFPPSKNARFFDCEGFLEHEGNFYLFTKNRSKNFDGSFNIYSVPNREGNFEAKLVGTLTTCGAADCRITGADISPDGQVIALLTEGNIFLITGFSNNNFNNVHIERLPFNESTQKEGICFTGNDTVVVVDEKTKQGGGNMYYFTLSGLRKQN